MAFGLVALWPCGLKLYKANELGNILAVCLNSRDLDWWTSRQWNTELF